MRSIAFLTLCAAACGTACGGAGKQTAEAPADTSPRESRRITAHEDLDEEDDSDDGIAIEGGRSVLQEGDINKVISKHARELEGCYADNVGRTPYVGGRVELKFRVAKDGVVKTVQVSSGDLGHWPVEKCILGVARGMLFPKPKGKGDAEFSFPIDFPGRGTVTPLEPDLADAQLTPRFKDLAACDGGPSGQVQVTAYVAVKGVVTSVGFAVPGEEPVPEDWADCALAKALTWKLTDPRGRVVKASTWYQP